MNKKNPSGPVGMTGACKNRIGHRRISPWALCQLCVQEVQDERYRNHPDCLARHRASKSK